jgi:hypothetical protein
MRKETRIPVRDVVTGSMGFFDCSKNRFVFDAQPVSLGEWIYSGSPVVVLEQSIKDRNLIRGRVVDYMLRIVNLPEHEHDEGFGAVMDLEERRAVAIQIIKEKRDLVGPLNR